MSSREGRNFSGVSARSDRLDKGVGGGGAEEKISRFEVSRGWHLCLWEVSANVGWSIIPVIMTIFIAIQRQ